MALHAGATGVPQHDDIFFVDPFTVEVPVRSRDKATDDEILAMAISLHVHGQRRAVECRNENGHLLLDHGFIRTMAARLIRSGFEYIDSETKEEVTVKDRRFTLKVVFAGPAY